MNKYYVRSISLHGGIKDGWSTEVFISKTIDDVAEYVKENIQYRGMETSISLVHKNIKDQKKIEKDLKENKIKLEDICRSIIIK